MNEPRRAVSWQNYRHRRRWHFAIWLGYIPGVFLIGFPLKRLFGSDIPFYVVAGGWMLAFLVSGVYLSLFPCPNCHQPFFFTGWVHNPFARRCMHCRFPKWGDPAGGDQHPDD
jgi:hypothetical protein